jgi:hypothetical protein
MLSQKTIAQRAVTSAVSSGRLRTAERCERCGAPDSQRVGQGIRLHAHHADYSKPLDVEWLCPSCHSKHHAAERAATGLRPITIRLSPDELANLRQRAATADMTVSEFVRRELGLRGRVADDVEHRLDLLDHRLSRLEQMAGL